MATTSELKTIEHHIGGQVTAGTGTRRGSVWDPATGHPQAEVLLGSTADVDAAVQAAKTAFETWGNSSLAHRARVMFAFRELVHANVDELARIVSSEHGKVLDDAKGE